MCVNKMLTKILLVKNDLEFVKEDGESRKYVWKVNFGGRIISLSKNIDFFSLLNRLCNCIFFYVRVSGGI